MPMVSAEGKFRARATGADLCESKNGTPQIAVPFAILDAGHAGESITWYGFLSPAAMERTLEGLRYAGWRGDDLGDLSGIGDAECEIVVKSEEYQGKTSLKVRWVNALWKPAAIPADRLAALIEATREAARASREAVENAPDGSPEPPPVADDPNAGAPSDDDLAF